MKIASLPKLNLQSIACAVLALLLFTTSCTKDKCETTRTYVRYNPVIKNLTEIRQFQVLPAQQMQAYGKIWLYGKYLLVNEPKKGIHIFDNSNPSSPQALSFISIPGNVDMAVRDNMLYADNYMDMLVIDMHNPQTPALHKRMENTFTFYQNADNNNSLVVDYEEELVTEKFENDCEGHDGTWMGISEKENFLLDNSSAGGGGNVPSMGGSMARFSMYRNYLYILNQNQLHPFEISNAAEPVKRQWVQMNWGMETLFPYKDKLFVGANNGMYIYDLANAEKPVMLTHFRHANACDPVVVENDIAYVTLRSGTRCEGFANQLDVVDVKDVRNPKLLKTYPMYNPHGLGIDNGTLFICDGADGLKVYNASDINSITDKMLGHYKNLDTYDVIPYNNILILTSKNGILQYDYSDPKNLKLLSKIAI